MAALIPHHVVVGTREWNQKGAYGLTSKVTVTELERPLRKEREKGWPCRYVGVFIGGPIPHNREKIFSALIAPKKRRSTSEEKEFRTKEEGKKNS